MSSKSALIVGNSHYQDSLLRRLTAPEGDVAGLAQALRAAEIGGFDPVKPLLDPSEAVLRREIGRFFAQGKKDDLLLLYFSGHGVLDERGELHLAVQDTEHDNLIATAVSARFLREVMDSSFSRRQVLVLDCCNSGAFGRGAKNTPGSSVGTANVFDVKGYGRVVLTASDATQYAWEGEQIRGVSEQSLFTHFLVQGLQTGEADLDRDGQITLQELYDYVYEQVLQATPKQKPLIFADRQQGQMVIARNPHPPAPAELAAELRQAIESPFAGVRAGAVEELGRLLCSGAPPIALAARAELERMLDDDSRKVSQAAVELLGRGQPSAVSQQPTAVSRQPSAISSQTPASAEDRRQATARKEPAPPEIEVPKSKIRAEPGPAALQSEILLPFAPGVGLALLRVPAGEFMMGSDKRHDSRAFDDELPQHTLRLEEYWIGKHPVTVAQFEAFVKATKQRTSERDWVKKADHPVVNVAWDDAMEFCRWASEQVKGQSLRVRLPSEAEWEKAARGGLQIPLLQGGMIIAMQDNPNPGRIYPWGDEPPDDRRCNFIMKVGGTTPVGRYSPQGDSPYGCADMAGNVWEWTSSLWGKTFDMPDYKYPYIPKDEREDPGNRKWRVVRGGSFSSLHRFVRCAYRYRDDPGFRRDISGFRVVLAPISSGL